MKLDTRDMLVIARRELLERVRSKLYVAMTLLGPIFMVALLVIPALIAVKSGRGARVEVIDKSGELGERIVTLGSSIGGWDVKVVPPTTADADELARVKADKINGFLVIPADAFDGGEILYRGDNASGQMFSATMTAVVRSAVTAARLARMNLSPDQIAALIKQPNLSLQHSTGEASGSSATGAFVIAYVLAFMLYMVLTIYGVAVMRSVVQEKTSRVMEFMVAVVKPRALMGGKILGTGGAAMIQLTVWLGIGALALNYRETVLGWFGIHGAGAAALPTLGGLEVSITLAFFVLGFFFYSAMYAAVGATVSSEQDTQQVQVPVTILLVIGVMCLQMVANAPRGSGSAIMSMIPLWSPMLMPMRFVLGGATLGEVGIALGLLAASLFLVVRAAAKIYRVGVLLYGKRPSPRELIRWLRY